MYNVLKAIYNYHIEKKEFRGNITYDTVTRTIHIKNKATVRELYNELQKHLENQTSNQKFRYKI